MPLYEFVCRDCGAQFEQIQPFSAKGHPPCPRCGSAHVSRLLGRPAIHFKGSGWYVTDSKGAGKQSANGESAKEPAKDGAKDSATDVKADAKPESKPDAKPDTKPDAKPPASGSQQS